MMLACAAPVASDYAITCLIVGIVALVIWFFAGAFLEGERVARAFLKAGIVVGVAYALIVVGVIVQNHFEWLDYARTCGVPK